MHAESRWMPAVFRNMAMLFFDAPVFDQYHFMLAGLFLGLARPNAGRQPHGLYAFRCCLRNKLGSGISPAKNNCKIQLNRNVCKPSVGFEPVNLPEIRPHGDHIVAHPVEVGNDGVAMSLREWAGADHRNGSRPVQ